MKCDNIFFTVLNVGYKDAITKESLTSSIVVSIQSGDVEIDVSYNILKKVVGK